MDSIVYEGTTYVKAGVLAKRFRYTTDYLGQLCRGGKIDARLVGRSWYINEQALVAHKEARYQPARASEKTIDSNTESSTDRHDEQVSVRPRLTRVTSKMLTQQSSSIPVKHFTERLAHTPVRYERDETDLLPQPAAKEKAIAPDPEPVSEKIAVEPAEANHLRIRITEKPESKLQFTDMPAVSLSGHISIENLDIEPVFDVPEFVSPVDLPTESEPVVTETILPTERAVTSAPVKNLRFTPTAVTAVARPVRTRSLTVLSVSIVTLGMALFCVLTLTTHVLFVDGSDVRSLVDFNLAQASLILSLLP